MKGSSAKYFIWLAWNTQFHSLKIKLFLFYCSNSIVAITWRVAYVAPTFQMIWALCSNKQYTSYSKLMMRNKMTNIMLKTPQIIMSGQLLNRSEVIFTHKKVVHISRKNNQFLLVSHGHRVMLVYCHLQWLNFRAASTSGFYMHIVKINVVIISLGFLNLYCLSIPTAFEDFWQATVSQTLICPLTLYFKHFSCQLLVDGCFYDAIHCVSDFLIGLIQVFEKKSSKGLVFLNPLVPLQMKSVYAHLFSDVFYLIVFYSTWSGSSIPTLFLS